MNCLISMSESSNTRIDFFEQLRKNWPVILFIGCVISSWTYFQFQLTNLTTRVAAVEQEASAIGGVSGDIKGINAKLDIILKKIEL